MKEKKKRKEKETKKKEKEKKEGEKRTAKFCPAVWDGSLSCYGCAPRTAFC